MGDGRHEYYGLSCEEITEVITEYFHTKHDEYPLIFHPSRLGKERVSDSDDPLNEGHLEDTLHGL